MARALFEHLIEKLILVTRREHFVRVLRVPKRTLIAQADLVSLVDLLDSYLYICILHTLFALHQRLADQILLTRSHEHIRIQNRILFRKRCVFFLYFVSVDLTIHFRFTEVAYSNAQPIVEEDVLGLEIAVANAFGVLKLQGQGYLSANVFYFVLI